MSCFFLEKYFYRRNCSCRSNSPARICSPVSDAGAFGLACSRSNDPSARDPNSRRLRRQVLRRFEHMLDLNRRKTRPLVRPPLGTCESVALGRLRSRASGKILSTERSSTELAEVRRRRLSLHSQKDRANVNRPSQVLLHRKRTVIYEPTTVSGAKIAIDKNLLLILTNDLVA
jgi:hypothetical protein